MATREEVLSKVRELVAAPSCNNRLREIGQEFLASIGDKDEIEHAKTFLARLEGDVMPIDDVIAFFKSEAGITKFGKELAEEFAEHVEEIKAKGAKFCDCTACAPGKFVLDNRELLLS